MAAEPQGTPFFLVWNPQGREPTYRHLTLTSARTEAECLAQQKPGKFFVMAAVDCFELTTMETTSFPFDRAAEAVKIALHDLSDDIPF